MTVIALNNQSLIDIAIQETGNPVNAIWIAQQNGLIPSSEVTAGTVLEIPTDVINDEDIKRYYTANNIQPATALTQQQKDELTGCEGIGYWAIETEFEVQEIFSISKCVEDNEPYEDLTVH